MAFQEIRYETRGAIGWITLHRPEAMNALTPQLAEELYGALTEAENTASVRALVITGAAPAFCAGADLKFIAGRPQAEFSESLGEFLVQLGELFNALESSPLPVIAAVNGLALAGGLELVLCCDLVIAAESAKLGDAHANYGLFPGGGGSVRLPRKIGPTRAKQLLFTGEFLPAERFYEFGLVNEVVAEDQLHSRAQALGELIASKSPCGISKMKRMVDDGLEQPQRVALRQEIDMLMLHATSADMKEGLAAFNEKRKPDFTGR